MVEPEPVAEPFERSVTDLGQFEQGLVEHHVLALPLRSQCRFCSQKRAWAEDRELLVDDPHIGIGLDQGAELGRSPLAVAAVVIEELDHSDVAIRIAADGRTRVALERIPAVGKCPGGCGQTVGFLAFGEDL